MKSKLKINSISIKLALLFSGLFIALLFILGFILYGAFTNLFIDYVKHDLLIRGKNHANVLARQFNQGTIEHVVKMESDVTTHVLITDIDQNILASSVPPSQDMKEALIPAGNKLFNGFIEVDWEKSDYIISVSAIGKNEGFVYMFYPSKILRDIVQVVDTIMLVSGIGIVLIAFGLIGVLSRTLTRPLITMKEATNKMALGKYKQKIPISGDDEVAQLGHSIQLLGEQLQEFEDSRNDFLASVSHELRTPLTYIKGYSDILNKDIVKTREEQQEYLQIINKEASRISLLVNDLLDMSKLQAGQFVLNKQQANVNLIIKKVFTTLKPAAAEKGIILSLDLAEDSPEIEIDVLRMEQAIFNLVENSIKYTNEGHITLRSHVNNEFLIIEVQDTGIGISPEDLPKIWSRFYRVDKSRTRSTGGSGLGLYVVKLIVEAHNGVVRANSTENSGSEFTIYLKI
ncbi:histidine kinase [Mesobacillus campisalis]|uniref:histidine kinase n=1 Tax=Mesobacillus campisalis TaxID=1408103 RepID=A0A0M2SUS9_9BACI|nr:ATP-binding protein [Mesobacillus campisalis]KKK37913.1 histidine kinase [Mesobacillus campisalis]